MSACMVWVSITCWPPSVWFLHISVPACSTDTYRCLVDRLCLDCAQQVLNLSTTLPAGLPASSQRSMYLGVYVGLGLGYSLLVFMRSWSNALGGFHARYGLAVSSCVH